MSTTMDPPSVPSAPEGPPTSSAPAGTRGNAWSRPFADISLSQNRPPDFPSVARWLLTGAVRNQRGMITALLVAWSNLPIAFFLAVVGAVTGALAGFEGTSPAELDLIAVDQVVSFGQVELGGMMGALVGGLAGAVEGFAAGLAGPWWDMFDGNGLYVVVIVVGQVFVGLLLGLGYLLLSVSCERLILRARGARRLSRREAEFIMPIVHEAAQYMGVRGTPAVLVRDSREVNAFATPRHLVISQGLLEEFNYDRAVVAGVVSHELAHWNNADPVVAAITRGVALPLSLVYGAAAKLMKTFPHPLVRLLVWALAWPVLIPVRYLVIPLQGPDQRAAETRADQAGIIANQRDGLRRFLVRTGHTVDGGRSAWDDAVGRTHPAAELRLEALEERGRAYRLPDRDASPRPLPVEITHSRDLPR